MQNETFAITVFTPAILHAHRSKLLSILDGSFKIREVSTIDASSVEVLAPRPQLLPYAFETILSWDRTSLPQTPPSPPNSRALLTPSVERVTVPVGMYGPVGSGRPSFSHQMEIQDIFPSYFDYDLACASTSSTLSSHTDDASRTPHFDFPTAPHNPWLQSTFEERPAATRACIYAEHSLGSPRRPLSPATYCSLYDDYHDRIRLYQLIDRTLSKSDLRVPAQKAVCLLLLTFANCWEFKIAIYGIVESLIDHAIQSGYPQNYDFVSLCITLREEIGNKWPGQGGFNIRQAYLSECFVDTFKEAWTCVRSGYFRNATFNLQISFVFSSFLVEPPDILSFVDFAPFTRSCI